VEPTRTCVGCRERSPKSGLVRLVVTSAGVVPDLEGHAPGRGAYVHRDPRCLDALMGKDALARALRTGLGPDELGRLRNTIETGVL
jgi:uncharacterized protein